MNSRSKNEKASKSAATLLPAPNIKFVPFTKVQEQLQECPC